jgi:XapX domain-containing protein
MVRVAASCCGRRNREVVVIGYAVSLVMSYGLVQVRSPAPPLIGLVGLLGMVMGERAIDMAKRHVSPFIQASVEDVHGCR